EDEGCSSTGGPETELHDDETGEEQEDSASRAASRNRCEAGGDRKEADNAACSPAGQRQSNSDDGSEGRDPAQFDRVTSEPGRAAADWRRRNESPAGAHGGPQGEADQRSLDLAAAEPACANEQNHADRAVREPDHLP